MKNFIIDMDGVLVQGNQIIPGADDFIKRLRKQKRKFLLLTNNPMYTPRDLAHRLQAIGIQIEENQIFSSALATAAFLHQQRPDGKAFVLGESGLTEAIHDIGYIITDVEPDYVVLGETLAYDFQMIKKAIRPDPRFWCPFYCHQSGRFRDPAKAAWCLLVALWQP